MKKRLPTILLILVFLTGLSLLLYPTVSDYINSLHQSRAIADYAGSVANLDNTIYEKLLTDARNYNAELAGMDYRPAFTEEEKREYENLLNVSGNGIIGYIEIPLIGCSLPIYHGTEEEILQIAVGHIDWTSLPVGGESTHCVLSGHRGLPSAKLFTDLDRLTEGDTFLIRVLDETLTYEVDQILIVEPKDTEALQIEKGKDYCTLVTCTPYGINTHRLLVRGHRIENTEEAEAIRVTADALQIDPMIIAPVVAVPMLLTLLILLMVRTGGKHKKNKEADLDVHTE